MKLAVVGLMLLAATAQANILKDIWHTIEKPLESLAGSLASSLLGGGGGLTSVIGSLFGKRDLGSLESKVVDEIHHWMQEAHSHVEHEMHAIEHALATPDSDHSSRIMELIHKMSESLGHGDIGEFIHHYSDELIKDFGSILPDRLKSVIENHEQRIVRSNDILLKLMRDITLAHWFFTLPEEQRLFFLDMLDAAEHDHLHDFVEHHTYTRVLTFIDRMPAEEGHKLNHYLSQHLQHEHQNNTTQEHTKRDMREFIKILEEIYAEHIYSILSKEDRVFLMELMRAAEEDKLTEFIADNSLARVEKFIESVPKSSGDKLTKFITEHMKNETHHHHSSRDVNILLGILKDIHAADVFFHLPESERNFMLELMDAGEHNKLDDFVKQVGIQRVRDFVKHLPEEFGTKMTHYITHHLHHHDNGTHAELHRRDTGIMISILKDIHSATIFFELPEQARHLLLDLLDAGENGHLTETIADHGIQKLEAFLEHLPPPHNQEFEKYIIGHLKNEVQSNHTGHDHTKRNDAILMVLLNNIHTADIFFHLPESERLYLLDLLDAAEHGHTVEFISKEGLERLEHFLDHMPKEYAAPISAYVTTHLSQEIINHRNQTQTVQKREHHDHTDHDHTDQHHHHHHTIHETLQHVHDHMNEHHETFTSTQHHIYEKLKHAIEHHELREFIENIGVEGLYDFLNAIPEIYAGEIEQHILTELEKEDNVDIN